MNRLLALISALMLWFTTVSVGVAQPSRDPSMVLIDSIKSLITPQISDSAKAAHYVDMAFIVYNIDSALHYCNTALELCRPTDTFLIARGFAPSRQRVFLPQPIARKQYQPSRYRADCIFVSESRPR